MQVGDADEVVVLKGIEYFLADVAVQNLKQVVDVFVLIRHLKCVHERCELSGCTGGYAGEIQTAELALLDSGALVASSPAKWHSIVMRPSVFSFTESAKRWQACEVMCSALWLFARRSTMVSPDAAVLLSAAALLSVAALPPPQAHRLSAVAKLKNRCNCSFHTLFPPNFLVCERILFSVPVISSYRSFSC